MGTIIALCAGVPYGSTGCKETEVSGHYPGGQNTYEDGYAQVEIFFMLIWLKNVLQYAYFN